MKKLKVIGIGNRIMGDDGIGVYVVEALLKQQLLNDFEYIAEINIEYIVGETDIDFCLDCVDNESFIIIIDAAMLGKYPGTVTELAINDINLCTSRMVSAHYHNLIEAARMHIAPCNLMIICIEPELVDYKLGLSDALNESFTRILENVKTCILKKCH